MTEEIIEEQNEEVVDESAETVESVESDATEAPEEEVATEADSASDEASAETDEVVSEEAPSEDDTSTEDEDVVSEDEEVQDDAESQEDAEESEVAEKEKPVVSDRPWYILQCYTSHEDKVKRNIEQLVEEEGFGDRIDRILVPEEETIEIKNNKRVEKITKIYPGYVFLQMEYGDDIYLSIRGLTGVANFIGSKGTPTPVVEEEILRVLRKVGDDHGPKVDIDFEVDEVIKVISGPFRGYTGPISEINPDRGTLKALISVFGRETPVKLDFDQVEKVIE